MLARQPVPTLYLAARAHPAQRVRSSAKPGQLDNREREGVGNQTSSAECASAVNPVGCGSIAAYTWCGSKLSLVLNDADEEWKRPPREWLEAKTSSPSSRRKVRQPVTKPASRTEFLTVPNTERKSFRKRTHLENMDRGHPCSMPIAQARSPDKSAVCPLMTTRSPCTTPDLIPTNP